jgi:hypothetical protein
MDRHLVYFFTALVESIILFIMMRLIEGDDEDRPRISYIVVLPSFISTYLAFYVADIFNNL